MVKWGRWLWLVSVLLLVACGIETVNNDATPTAVASDSATVGMPETAGVQFTPLPPTPDQSTAQPLSTYTPSPATGTTTEAAASNASLMTTALATTTEATAANSATSSTATVTTVVSTTAGEAAGGSKLTGKLIFRRDDDLYLYHFRTGQTQLVIKGGDLPRFSVDGKQLAWVSGDVLYVGGPNGERPRALGSYATINQIAWAPDGTRLLFERTANEGKDSEVWVADVATGSAKKIADGSDAAWAPDSKRIAYVTLPGDEPIRKTQLRLVNYQGENGWAVVTDVPANAPPIGPPTAKRQPAQFEHVLSNPVWDESGNAIYVVSLIGSQVESDFGMWERADAHNGGSTFVNELVDVFDVVGAPNRSAALLVHSTARGDTYFAPQPLSGDAASYSWVKTEPGFHDDAPAWSPDSQALAYYHCPLDPPGPCDILLRSASGSTTLIPHVLTPDANGSLPEPLLDWAPDS